MRAIPAGVVLAVWCVSVQIASAQNGVTITGAVVDATHAPMPRVAVTFEDEARQITHRVLTDGRGRFLTAELPAGDYLVEADVRGFVPFSGRLVVAGPSMEREIVLEPAGVTETITVVAGETPRAGDVRTRGPADACEVQVDPETLSAVGGQLQPPRMLAHPRPRFPEHLQDAVIDGHVRLLGRIGTDGLVADLQVTDGAHPDLAAAAEEAVRQWTWEEALLNCEPVEIGVAIDVQFVRGSVAQ